ncbi:hypothetical protein Cantr_01234 [Candida viswanathii]|uniref:Uncharacterized protein n=1 Tax=Candida viswanathii TaxID=5486 RepID=A0A367YI21_9ASCO|nr:hypothetical protein Cantr_01234 [Candida viswanathii]
MSPFEKPISSVQPDRFVYVVDYYLCKIIHNPFVSSGLILSCYAYYLATTPHSITHRYASSDILSNIINIIAVCRFLFKQIQPSFRRTIFFILQIITSFFILDTSAFSPLVVLSIYFQIFLPFVVILIAYANKSTLHEGLKSANNSFLPFFLSYSIMLMNNELWFNTTVPELAYSLSSYPSSST